MEIPSICLQPHLDRLERSSELDATRDVADSIGFQDLLETSAELREGTSMQVSPSKWPGVLPPRYALNGLPVHSSRTLSEQIKLYQEDQLLAHPGGDYVELDASDPRKASVDHGDFWARLGKDLKDAAANLGNFFQDLFWGSEYRYIDEHGRAQTAQRRGLIRNVFEFFKDMLSGLSFGHYRPDGELEPKGLVKRVQFMFEKIAGEAIMDDLVFGAPASAVHLADDAVLALWNLIEIVPDATIGSIPAGRGLVTTVFDNGQVMIDYLTDCIPTGEAWMRVHAYRLDKKRFVPPVIYNVKLPERFSQDPRWQTIRNTPFRKAIETIGSLLADAWLAKLTSHAIRTSKRRS